MTSVAKEDLPTMRAHPEIYTGGYGCRATLHAEGSSFLCTREEEHPGSHMANGYNEVLALWDDQLSFVVTRGWVVHEAGTTRRARPGG